MLRTTARFPEVPREKGHYESFYLKASHPSEPLGVWIRYTMHKHSGQEPRGSLWFTLFDGAAEGPAAAKVTTNELSVPDGGYIQIGDSTFGDGHVRGGASTERLDASWELSFESAQDPLFHLPRDWMYRAPVPRTKLLSPYPDARFEGSVRAGDREVSVDGWRGMIGHNWGAQHAERWIWLHGITEDGDWLDAGIGRVKLGRLVTPWIGNGALSVAGDRYPLRRAQVTEYPDRCTFRLSGRRVELRGTVEAPRERFVGWVYADPVGPEHNTVNCSISDMELTVERKGRKPLRLECAGAAAYELGMRETDHGIPIQPYPDG